MSETYRKLHSFAGLRQKGPMPDVLPRLRGLRDRLPGMDLPEARRKVVRKALDDLFGGADPAESPPFSLHPPVVEEIGRLTDEELPRYLFYRYRYEIYPLRRIADDFPPCLQIEPTSVCNYRCVFCYQTDESFTGKAGGHMGHMAPELFRDLVDQCAGRCEAVTLASRGEPLLHPKIGELLAYTRGKFLALKLNTNASVLDERKAHAILEAEPQTVVFSADAASEPHYGRFRVGGVLDKVLQNVRRFQEIRAKQYPKSRTITRVSGVKVPGTPDLDKMEKFWGEFVDQVAFVDYNPWQNTYERDVNDIVDPCTALWFRMFVWWDGRANPCDNDYLSRLCVGDAREKRVGDLWRSDKFEELRRRHGEGARRKCFPCDRCPVI